MKHSYVPLLVSIFLGGIGTLLPAQQVMLNLRAGINVSTVTGIDAGAENMPRAGIHLGGEAEVPVAADLLAGAGLLFFSQKGTNNRNTKFVADYIEVPLWLRWQGLELVDLLGGIQPAFLLQAYVNDGRGDITRYIRNTDLGIYLGADYRYGDDWLFGLRIAQGAVRVGESGQERTFHSVIYLTAAYRLVK